MTKVLKFFIKENGSDFGICDMTEPERAAISECVSDLIPDKYLFDAVWFEVDTCILTDEDDDSFDEDDTYEEPKYGLLRCFRHNPNPRYFTSMKSKLPTDFPQDVLDKLAGKTFRIYPRQLGVNPWGVKIELRFESVEPVVLPAVVPEPAVVPAQAEPPKNTTSGTPASVLIAAALKKPLIGTALIASGRVTSSDLIAASLKTQ